MDQENYLQNSYIKLPPILSGSAIKLIAILSMLIDHIAAVILTAYYAHTADIVRLENIYSFMRGIGRIAFPLFSFLAVEGFVHTKNRIGYLIRLLLFALVSEPAFDLAFSGQWLDYTQQNVMFTLLIGIFAIWVYDEIERRTTKKNVTGLSQYLLGILPIFLFAYAANILRTDYAAAGVLTIGIMYVHRDFKLISFLAGISVLCLTYGSIQIPGFLSVIPVLFYSGKRGFGLKYFFYIFYPAHLLILAYISANLYKIVGSVSG